ncbi:MAG TPA: glycosyltransferase [Chthoniobacterales bacterium]
MHEKSKAARFLALLGLGWACIIFRPNLLYLNQAGCYRIARAAARCMRIPVVAHVRIFEDAAYLARQKPKPAELRAIVAISDAVRSEISKFDALRHIPVKIIYDGYTPAVNRLAANAGKDARNSNSIACVGRIVPIKGQDVLVDAIGLLHPDYPQIRCAMIGRGGAFWEELKNRSVAAGLNNVICWTGFQGDPTTALRAVSILVLPSHREPLGRVIFEAWDAGCLPIAFRGSGGAAEVLQASGGGLLYDEQTPAALAAAMEEALSFEADERMSRVQKGRSWMTKHCSPERYAASMREVFVAAISAQRSK